MLHSRLPSADGFVSRQCGLGGSSRINGSRSTKRARSRRWIAPNRDCRSSAAAVAPDPRLRPHRHHHAVRRLRYPGGRVVRRCMPAAQASGVHPLPPRHRARGPSRKADPRHPRQLCRPQTPKGHRVLARHPRVAFHFTPTSGSGLSAVEGFFAKLTKQRLKRGVFKSLVSLQAANNRYLDQANNNPHPFRWTKGLDKIIAPSCVGTKCWVPLGSNCLGKLTAVCCQCHSPLN
jgi:hypothetical protein